MRGIAAATLVLALTSVGCDNSNSDNGTPAPSGPQTTETFTGTVAVGVGMNDFHNFTVAQAGEVDVTLTAAGPPSTIFMGLGIGTGGTACALLTNGTTTTPAGTTAQLTGTVNAGTYCVEVYDVGNATVPITYSVTVAHP
jgi:hypothetical protein